MRSTANFIFCRHPRASRHRGGFLASATSFVYLVFATSHGNRVWAKDDLQGTVVGTVDMQKALQTTKRGRAAQSTLEKEFTAKKKKLDEEDAAVKKLTDEFKKQEAAYSEPTRMKKGGLIQEKAFKLRAAMAQAENEIKLKERELIQPIIGDLRREIADIARRRKMNLVLERNENFVLYSEDPSDLTDEVISQFDKKSSSD